MGITALRIRLDISFVARTLELPELEAAAAQDLAVGHWALGPKTVLAAIKASIPVLISELPGFEAMFNDLEDDPVAKRYTREMMTGQILPTLINPLKDWLREGGVRMQFEGPGATACLRWLERVREAYRSARVTYALSFEPTTAGSTCVIVEQWRRKTWGKNGACGRATSSITVQNQRLLINKIFGVHCTCLQHSRIRATPKFPACSGMVSSARLGGQRDTRLSQL